jgi:hypothetical protein
VKSRNVVPTVSGDSGNFLSGEIFLDIVKHPTSSGMITRSVTQIELLSA